MYNQEQEELHSRFKLGSGVALQSLTLLLFACCFCRDPTRKHRLVDWNANMCFGIELLDIYIYITNPYSSSSPSSSSSSPPKLSTIRFPLGPMTLLSPPSAATS